MTLQPGQQAVVRVAVATLWARPESVRPIDAPALASRSDIPRWISGMDAEQQVGACVLSQLLFGERVLVEEVRLDGWVRAVAVEQSAAKLDARGYPGWLRAEHLAHADASPGDVPLVVDAIATQLRATPGGEVVIPDIVLGTRLFGRGAPRDGWWPVGAPGRAGPLWLPERDVVPVPDRMPSAAEVLAVAGRLRDVVYIWGGVSSYGLDCSGLVHLAWRRLGVSLPRDADDQARATRPVAIGAERPGDLYFFARPGRPIHHIAIVSCRPDPSAGRRMLHACYKKRRVVEEPMSAERAATLVGVHRV
jgi:hypothetical protein